MVLFKLFWSCFGLVYIILRDAQMYSQAKIQDYKIPMATSDDDFLLTFNQ